MSVLKSKNSKIESYEFGQLSPSKNSSANAEAFEFKALDKKLDFKTTISEDKIRQERESAADSGFAISAEVREHRGLSAQGRADFEARVAEEVTRRVEVLGQEAYKEGLEQGKAVGHEQALNEGRAETEVKIEELVQMIESLQENMQNIYQENKNDVFLMVKNLTKWVILKEVDEKHYLTRLLEKLIYEINSKSNLVVRVNEEALGHMSEVIKIVERKMGKLTNVRVEHDIDQEGNGIVLESENTIVDGGLETQFRAIDKIFDNAGVNES